MTYSLLQWIFYKKVICNEWIICNLSQFWRERFSALLASFGFLISMVLVIIFIPNIPRKSRSTDPYSLKSTFKRINSSGSKDNVSPSSIFNITEIFYILSLPKVGVEFLYRFKYLNYCSHKKKRKIWYDYLT